MRVLRGVAEFARCSDHDLSFLATCVDEVCVPAGILVAEQGRLCHEFVVVAGGELESCRGRRLGPGDTLGWDAMTHRAAHDSTVRSLTPSHLLVMSHRQFQNAAAFAGPPSPAGPSPARSPVRSVGAARPHANPGC